MVKLWDRLRRRIGGGNEQRSDPARVWTEVAERPAQPDQPGSPDALAAPPYSQQNAAAGSQRMPPPQANPSPWSPAPPEHAQRTVVPERWAVPAAELEQRTSEDGWQDGLPPHMPHPLQPAAPDSSSAAALATSQPQPPAPAHGGTDTSAAIPMDAYAADVLASPISLPSELLPLTPTAAPQIISSDGLTDNRGGLVPERIIDGAAAAGDDVEAPWAETLAELAELAAVEDMPAPAHPLHESDTNDDAAPARDHMGADRTDAPGEDDDDSEDDTSLADDAQADPGDGVPLTRPGDAARRGSGTRTNRRRGQRGEPGELDGQPARMVLPGRPLKRNEVPTLDTPLLVWSHAPSGEVVVRPELYACVETQWYGSSLYFLVIPWTERDAPDHSARLVVDATQLRVAPQDMPR